MTDRSPAGKPNPDYVQYTSDAYVPEPETEVEQSTAEWLETQSQMTFIREVARRTFELMDLRPGESVLDVGCGTGVLLPSLAEAVGAGGSVTGLDHSAAFLGRAARRLQDAGLAERVRLVHSDAYTLPFGDGTFDVSHIERVLMHLQDPDAVIREMVRVTRPGGRVACAEVFAYGADIDIPDHQAGALIGDAIVAQIRHPAMGIQIRRRLISASLENVTTVAVADVETRMVDDEIDEYRLKAAELVEQGLLDRRRADTAIRDLLATTEAGTYTGTAIIFVAVGTVPAITPR